MAERLVLADISYAYPFTRGVFVLEEVNLVIEPGDVVCIAGRNGSGKSTLAQIIAGILRPTGGSVFYSGQPVNTRNGLRRLRKSAALLFQSAEEQLFADTVFRDISFGPENRGTRGPELHSIVRESAELAGLKLEEVETRSPFSLSEGEKRMVALAGVFALKPEILILDEPFTGLDYENKIHLRDSLIKYQESRDASLIIISHELSDVWPVANKFGLLVNGKLREMKSKKEVVSAVDNMSDLGLRLPQWSILRRELGEIGIEVSDPSNYEMVAEAIRGYIGGSHD